MEGWNTKTENAKVINGLSTCPVTSTVNAIDPAGRVLWWSDTVAGGQVVGRAGRHRHV